jgi:hypothetical protein
MTGYYDFILGLIPLALVGVTGVLNVAGLAATTAVPVGAGVAVLLVGHALFVNGPVDTSPSSTSTSARSSSSTRSSGPVNSAD